MNGRLFSSRQRNSHERVWDAVINRGNRDNMSDSKQARLAVDIGGTFTDIVLETSPGQHITGKYLTTHGAPEQAVLEGTRDLLAKSGISPSQIRLVVHGTTLATNALIERKGAKTALISTAGFRDSLEMAYEHRFEVSDLYMVRPAPLVPRNLRLEVDERLAADGSVLRELDETSVRALVPALKEQAVEALAVCLLHSYVNGAHEKRVRDILRTELPDLKITLSHEICPEIREFERGSTVCANAYVQPIMESYLRRLASGLKAGGIDAQVMLMMSSGGLTSLDIACQQPIKLVESGPAGGAVLAADIARKLDLDAAIAFDMGGTTAKLVLIDKGLPHHSRHLEVARAYRFLRGSGMPLRVPVIDLVEIGAGGGSIARVDDLGRVEVGPESAGSEPGPACYGRGGTNPTVTDADLIMGKIDPETFAGGMITLDIEGARKALTGKLGGKVQLDARTSAIAIAEVVDENMANAARVHATDNGAELEGRTMIAFGGAAPMHAARIAQKLGIDTVVVPRGAGVGSAHGFLLAPVSYEAVRTRLLPLRSFDVDRARSIFAEMREEAASFVRLGVEDDAPLEERLSVYIRYRGQGHEVQVRLPANVFEGNAEEIIRSLFEVEYRNHFGRIIPKMEIECLTWTLTLSAETPLSAQKASGTGGGTAVPRRSQTLVDLASMEDNRADVYLRADLGIGATVKGPAIIGEAETNTMVPVGFTATIDSYGNLILQNARA